MKYFFLLSLGIVFLVSCSSSTTKVKVQNTDNRKYIYVVDKTYGYSSVYSEEGHVMIYGKDSINNYIVYFAKFDKNAGKYENRIIKEKIVRAEMDSSLSKLKSFITISGGAICNTNKECEYDAYYFDEKILGNYLENIEIPMTIEQSSDINLKSKIKRILKLLDVGYNIALLINDTNAEGWHNIVSALEPIQEIISYDVIENDTIYDSIVKKHISKISITTEGLTLFYNLLREKYASQSRNTIQ